MSVRGPNNVGRAVQTDPTLLRYTSAITGQKKCCNRVRKRMQHACNIQQCWELLVNNVAFVCTQPYNERMDQWTYEWVKAWMNERENGKMKEGINYDIMKNWCHYHIRSCETRKSHTMCDILTIEFRWSAKQSYGQSIDSATEQVFYDYCNTASFLTFIPKRYKKIFVPEFILKGMRRKFIRTL